ncbi:MAG: metallophosphoesterase [Vicinamibacterales bacterium]
MHIPRRLALATVCLAVVAAPLAQSPQVDGVFYIDDNGNGQRDAGEPGMAGVAVSNQREVVVSGIDGGFRLASAGTGVAFVSVADGHRATTPFWAPAGRGLSFGLARAATPPTFSFLHGSDPHTSAESVGRLRAVAAIADARRPDFVLMTGDLVKDALRVGEAEAAGYYALYQAEIARFPVPVWSVPGNHENFGIERHLSLVGQTHPLYGKGMFRARLGPTYYSFTHGGIHFVGLDTVDIADLWYHGHVDAAQLAWLRADLAATPRGMPVVTFDHIPLASAADGVKGFTDEGTAPTTLRVNGRQVFRHVVSNLDEVAAAIAPHPWPLALGGHIHLRESVRFGSPLSTRFEQAAAIVGGGNGVVPAVSGVTLYRVQDGAIDGGEFLALDPR